MYLTSVILQLQLLFPGNSEYQQAESYENKWSLPRINSSHAKPQVITQHHENVALHPADFKEM